ncbi:MAG: glycosyltransferase [Acidobacteria bacterium]|nr:glycosyltransferase [Acidobacteriota bacterium]
MGAGRPVVATNVGGASEVIVEGRTGYLVESGDYETMAARIIDLLKNPDRANEMGQSGRQIVQQKFSCQAQLEVTERLYERLLAKKNQRGIRQIEVEID